MLSDIKHYGHEHNENDSIVRLDYYSFIFDMLSDIKHYGDEHNKNDSIVRLDYYSFIFEPKRLVRTSA